MIHTSNFSCTELNIHQEETSEFSSCTLKVTVDLQRPNFGNFFFFVPDIAKISI